MDNKFPQEYLFPIEGQEAFLGRIIIERLSQSYTAEISIVTGESKKIYKHINTLFNYTDPRELFEVSLHGLASYLRGE
jgi:hypothetical protein